MKILIVSAYDIKGGAARATYRLHKSLQNIGVCTQMVVQDKTSDDCTVFGPKSKIKEIFTQLRPGLNQLPVKKYRSRQQITFSPSWLPLSEIVSRVCEIDPDIVHLHWVTGGMIRIEDLAKINKPIVWSLHDMWAFTGGCHYDNYCGKYENECAFCPVLDSNKNKDLSNKEFVRKKRVYKTINNLTIVGLSEWITDCAIRSVLLGNSSIINIPNPINTETFIQPYPYMSDRYIAKAQDLKTASILEAQKQLEIEGIFEEIEKIDCFDICEDDWQAFKQRVGGK